MASLTVKFCSQDSCRQRKGRAGRVKKGRFGYIEIYRIVLCSMHGDEMSIVINCYEFLYMRENQ